MLVPGDNEVSLDLHGTFEDSIIRLISQDMETRLGFYYDRNLGHGPQEVCDPILLPAKFLSELLCHLSQNGNRGVQGKVAFHGMEITFFGFIPRDDEGRDEDIGVKDDFQTQRPSKTILSTSSSVKTPFPLASLAP